MIVNILLSIFLLVLTTVLFIKVYISEDEVYEIYNKIEEKETKHLEGKPTVYKFFYHLLFSF